MCAMKKSVIGFSGGRERKFFSEKNKIQKVTKIVLKSERQKIKLRKLKCIGNGIFSRKLNT